MSAKTLRERVAEAIFVEAGWDDWGVANSEERAEFLGQADAVLAVVAADTESIAEVLRGTSTTRTLGA